MGRIDRKQGCLAFASLLLGLGAFLSTLPADAQDEPSDEPNAAPVDVVVQGRRKPLAPIDGQASSRVQKQDLNERLPRSAPDALRYEPGVYVQQTAHGQGSAFIRGRTGQQTVLLFDGIRLNTSTFRQGPNQYFFTVDARTIHHIDVVRGGASTRWGSDAIGGVIHAHPMEPRLDLSTEGPVVRPRTMIRYASADHEFGERFQVDAQVSQQLRALAGVGYRRVGQLRGGGPVRSPATGAIPQVPAFESDGKTQLGTGFWEATADGRVVYQPTEKTRVVGAVYAYRQFDAPRTDQCPPPFAPRDECLNYDEQFRTLAYGTVDTSFGDVAKQLRVALSYQNQHERRTRERPSSFAENGGRDEVDTFGLSTRGTSEDFALGNDMAAKVEYGADVYHDRVDSTAWTRFTDLDMVIPSTRGLYLGGSTYTHGGAFLEPAARLLPDVILRTGGRLGGAHAYAPSDPETGTAGVNRSWRAAVGHAGVEWQALKPLALLFNIDRSFRAPNLDDLTSRQQTGPGFQFENPNLRPETALTLEAGTRLRSDMIEAEAWVFRSGVHDAITRVSRSATQCPPSTPQCAASWTRFQLANAPGEAVVRGVELAARARLPHHVVTSATFAATRGETDNPQERPSDPSLAYEERVPLSRIPPANGTFELRWRPPSGVVAGASVRWALSQTRLAPTDRSDARIPEGGTPGFAVVDLIGGVRIDRTWVTSVVLENVGDAAYRYHGSSVNGPGRGVILNLEAGL